MKDAIIALRIKEADKAEIASIAAKEGISSSELIREAVRIYIKEYKDGNK